MDSYPRDNMDFYVDYSEQETEINPELENSDRVFPSIPFEELFEPDSFDKENALSIHVHKPISTDSCAQAIFSIEDEFFSADYHPELPLNESEVSENTIESIEKSWEAVNGISVSKTEEKSFFPNTQPDLSMPENEILLEIEEKTENGIFPVAIIHESEESTLPQMDSNESIEAPLTETWLDIPEEKLNSYEPLSSPIHDLFLENILETQSEDKIIDEPSVLFSIPPPKESRKISFYKGKYKINILVSETEKDLYFNHFSSLEAPVAEIETDNIIAQFLLNEPKINLKHSNKPVKEFIPTEEDIEQEIVTETMAKILVLQGQKQEAIKIYTQLGLEFPEKSAYFAALIEELK